MTRKQWKKYYRKTRKHDRQFSARINKLMQRNFTELFDETLLQEEMPYLRQLLCLIR